MDTPDQTYRTRSPAPGEHAEIARMARDVILLGEVAQRVEVFVVLRTAQRVLRVL